MRFDTAPTRWRAGPAWLLALALALLVPVASPSTASAQERFRLTEEGWRQETRYEPGTPQGELQAIRRLLAEGRARQARERAHRWLKRRPRHPLAVEAHLLRGDARVATGEEYKALYDYEAVIRNFPGSEHFLTALEREYRVAQMYAAGLNRKFLGMRVLPAGEEAEELFIRIQERAPGSEIGERASMALGDYYFRDGQMSSAAEAYSLFLLNYPQSERRERAMLRAIQANLATFKGPSFDARGLIEAGERLRQYQQEYPAAAERIGADALLVRIEESQALKSYETAEWYRRKGLDRSAITAYQAVVRDHPQTAAALASIERLQLLGAPPVPARRGTEGAATAPGEGAEVGR